jgi:hypothetical protein
MQLEKEIAQDLYLQMVEICIKEVMVLLGLQYLIEELKRTLLITI